ncbi:MAG: hypothetical protein EOM67_07300 [Spirochaetia bacterium]|nr:hypothetical protein [Spirochaetia bacterium]
MDIITNEKLQEILSIRSAWCISLFMPTHRAGRETEQDPIRYKNLLSEAEERLLAKGLGAHDVKKMLKAPKSLLEATPFWQHQSDGLALFFSIDYFYLFRLPLEFTPMVFVNDRFHIKQLLPILNSDGTFNILAISQNKVRLFKGTQQTIDEIDLPDTPDTLSESFPDDWPKQKFQFQTMGSSGKGGQGGNTHAHATGTDVKVRLKKWFRKIEKEVTSLLKDTQSPLVLAGVDTLFPIYSEVNTYPNLVEEGIPGNPDEMTGKELHPKAWALVEPIFTKERETGIALYRQLADTEQTTNDITKALLGAYRGQVKTLFVALGVQVWGNYDPEKEEVLLYESHQSGAEDLLDLAAIQTLIMGGAVFAVPPEDVPSSTLVAAVFRY